MALCCIGPILAVLILGICLSSTEISYTPCSAVPTVFHSDTDVGRAVSSRIPRLSVEMAVLLAPICRSLFLEFSRLFRLRLKKQSLIKIF